VSVQFIHCISLIKLREHINFAYNYLLLVFHLMLSYEQ
jgi:hypothetical protein